MKINKTMTTYNQHGTFNWFEVDGETYILFKVGSNSALLNQHYEDVTEQQSEIYGLLGRFHKLILHVFTYGLSIHLWSIYALTSANIRSFGNKTELQQTVLILLWRLVRVTFEHGDKWACLVITQCKSDLFNRLAVSQQVH